MKILNAGLFNLVELTCRKLAPINFVLILWSLKYITVESIGSIPGCVLILYPLFRSISYHLSNLHEWY